MLKSELLKILNDKLPNLTLYQVEPAVNCLLKQIEKALVQGEHIEVRGFGCFDLRHHAPRKARNPKTGEALTLPARVSVHFKPGKELRERVNAESNQYPIET
ncbi:MAG: HU family DNA-binding protein [Methylococcales bacterium]